MTNRKHNANNKWSLRRKENLVPKFVPQPRTKMKDISLGSRTLNLVRN